MSLGGGKTLELGLVFPPSLAPPPFPHLNRKESAPSINTGQYSRIVTTTNWRLDQRSWRPNSGSWLLGTKRASFPQICEQCGPHPRVLVVFLTFKNKNKKRRKKKTESVGKRTTDSKSFRPSQTSRSDSHRSTYIQWAGPTSSPPSLQMTNLPIKEHQRRRQERFHTHPTASVLSRHRFLVPNSTNNPQPW